MIRMAEAALRKREQAASKLAASIRQLKRYVDQEEGKHSERILVQKSDKVDLDREELIAKHIQYSEKSNIKLTEPEMEEFINEKIDEAVDVVDEASALIEKLDKKEKSTLDDSKKRSEEKKVKQELKCAQEHAESLEKMMIEALTDIDQLLLTVDPTEVHAVQADMYVLELEGKQEELNRAWLDVKLSLIHI